jgi:3-dehydroquinate dehydratase type I
MMNGKNKVCVSYAGGRIEDLDSAIVLCDYLELRMDLCSFSESEYKSIFSKFEYTIAADHSVKSKENLLKAIDYGAKIIDIDINNPNFDDLYTKIKSQNRKLIISFHNYEELPKPDEMNEFIKVCVDRKADYAKIACKLNTNQDILKLMELYKNPFVANGKIKLLAMGLGELGPLSRLMACAFNSPFIYCSYVSELATADGQLSVLDFLNIYDKLFIK